MLNYWDLLMYSMKILDFSELLLRVPLAHERGPFDLFEPELYQQTRTALCGGWEETRQDYSDYLLLRYYLSQNAKPQP